MPPPLLCSSLRPHSCSSARLRTKRNARRRKSTATRCCTRPRMTEPGCTRHTSTTSADTTRPCDWTLMRAVAARIYCLLLTSHSFNINSILFGVYAIRARREKTCVLCVSSFVSQSYFSFFKEGLVKQIRQKKEKPNTHTHTLTNKTKNIAYQFQF